MTRRIATAAAGVILAAVLGTSPAQAYHAHAHPVQPSGFTAINRDPGAPVTLEEWQAVQLGWSRFHVQNVFDNDGVLLGDWQTGADSYKEKQYPVDDLHLVRIVYVATNTSPEWGVSVKEWCTVLPTHELSCLT